MTLSRLRILLSMCTIAMLASCNPLYPNDPIPMTWLYTKDVDISLVTDGVDLDSRRDSLSHRSATFYQHLDSSDFGISINMSHYMKEWDSSVHLSLRVNEIEGPGVFPVRRDSGDTFVDYTHNTHRRRLSEYGHAGTITITAIDSANGRGIRGTYDVLLWYEIPGEPPPGRLRGDFYVRWKERW